LDPDPKANREEGIYRSTKIISAQKERKIALNIAQLMISCPFFKFYIYLITKILLFVCFDEIRLFVSRPSPLTTQ